MEQRENVQVLFLGNITHQIEQQAQGSDKSSYQDQISFSDPVQIELIRIPNQGKQMYSRLISQTQVKHELTQKQPIKSLQIYYRNLDKKLARYSLLVCSSSELLVSSSIDILVTLRETIYTDLLVIRGNFTNITFCIYGKAIRSKQEIEKKCPYFLNNIEVQLHEQQPSIKINRNVFNESRERVKAIEDEYTQTTDEQKVYNWDGYSNDRELYDSQITNICKLSQQLLVFEDLNHIQQRSSVQIRRKLQAMQSHLSKLFKSAHIGLYYPTPYRATAIPEAIPVTIVKLAIKLLSESLSDQYRALEVLKLILQLGPHAQQFVKLGGVEALIHLFLEFFSPNLVILSSLKLLAVQVFIVLSFWQFSAHKMVEKLSLLSQQPPSKSNSHLQNSSQQEEISIEKPKQKSRSRDKKKKRSQEKPSKSLQRQNKRNKKEKKSKKNKDKQKRSRSRSKDKKKQKNKSEERVKQKKNSQKQKSTTNLKKQQKLDKQPKNISQEQTLRTQISQCHSFYEIIFKIINFQKNSKLQQLMRILILQITQILSKNTEVSNQMANYTPLLRDTKYMLNQGGEMINSKTLKTFASFYPFLNYQQSKGVDSPYICESEKIKQPKKYHISPKLFKLIDSALSILQSKSEDEAPIMFDQYFMTLISALIENNKNGVAIGLNYFIDAIRVDSLLGLKRQQAIIAIICEYIHEVFIEDEGMNLIFYLDQIHNSMLKIINWLKEDKTFSIQIKRKVQYLINSALIYNHFSGTQNNFKSFSQYFIKLIGHQNLDINKILQYSRKQYNKTVNPLTFTNLSENFGLGNFYDVLPAQPLLQIDICLRMFLAILKLNKNIWTVFYQFKFVPAFATLYLKIHSLLKFFMTPSLQKQNAIIDIKMLQRLINNYLQVLKHLTNLFICKLRYESAFNQLTEEEDIFNSIQLYEKWIQTYVFLYNSLHDQNSLLCQQKTTLRIKQILTNIIQLFDVALKGYQLTKFVDRQKNIKSAINFIYKEHYQSIALRSGLISIINVFLTLADTNTIQMLSNYLLQKFVTNHKESDNFLLPDNQKSIFQNLLRKNIYRSDQKLIQNISDLIAKLLKQDNTREKVWEILQTILDQNQAHLNEQLDQLEVSSLTCQKITLYLNLLSFVKAPMNLKICQHILRLLKISINLTNSIQNLNEKKLKLRNSYLRFFKTAISYSPQISIQLFQQYLKSISNLLQFEVDNQNILIQVQILQGILLIIQTLIMACQNVSFQSIILYGQVIQRPTKPACQINLQKLFSYFKQKEKRQHKIIQEKQSNIITQIGVSLCYFLCKLTTINGVEFFSTQSRKNALNYLVSPQKSFSLLQILTFMDDIVPHKITQALKNYIDFPLIQKQQVQPLKSAQQLKKQKKSISALLSKGIFTMISQNDPVGKTRYQLIQDRWQGGDTDRGIFQVNIPLNYSQITQKIVSRNIQIAYVISNQSFKFQFQGTHQEKIVNSLFQFKIRKIFTQQAKKNALTASSTILMKNIPNQIKKPQVIVKDTPGYMSKLNTSPSANKNIIPLSTQPVVQNPSPIPSKNMYQPNPNPNTMRASSSNNRQPSPYGVKPVQTTPIKPNYPVSGPVTGYINQPVSTYPPMTTNPQSYYQPISKPPYVPPVPKPYNQPNMYEQPMNPTYDSRGYYSNPPYETRGHMGYQPNYMGAGIHSGGYPRPPVQQPQPLGYPNPYAPSNIYQPPQNVQAKQVQQGMATQAINILLYLQQNPNVPDKDQLKAKVNKLFQVPSVHQRVTNYFQQIQKKN